jgi:hypothetical protein
MADCWEANWYQKIITQANLIGIRFSFIKAKCRMFVCMEAIGNVKEPRDFFYHYHLQLQAIKSLWQAVGRQVDAKNI